ncbi:MAG TPA: hypothetical protein VKT28_14570 [Puia sp.]|nr:hypothetical protein [Puia sp.]
MINKNPLINGNKKISIIPKPGVHGPDGLVFSSNGNAMNATA